MDERARTLRSQRVYEGRLLRIDLEQVELPGGGRAELETIRHPGAAAVLPFLDDGRVVLIRQYRHAVGGFIVEVPAGKLDRPGEAPEECAQRELREETGYRCRRLVPLGRILTTPGFTDEVIWLYEAHDLQPGPGACEEGEKIEVFEVGWEQALALLRRGEIVDAKSVACLAHAALRRGIPSPL
ncbi:MAG: NUDIX hydrolase [Acidobacteriota bacterium]|nr:NUDIX hydrolase [Acidobacteriota bacterium]MDQ7089017.1 NUDIX hydrolase [Acidobacteriota bacterium]